MEKKTRERKNIPTIFVRHHESPKIDQIFSVVRLCGGSPREICHREMFLSYKPLKRASVKKKSQRRKRPNRTRTHLAQKQGMNIASPRPSRKQQPRAIEDQTNDRKRSVTTTSASLSTNTLVPRRSTPALRVLATASVVPRVAREVSDVIIELFASHQIEARGPSTPSTRN